MTQLHGYQIHIVRGFGIGSECQPGRGPGSQVLAMGHCGGPGAPTYGMSCMAPTACHPRLPGAPPLLFRTLSLGSRLRGCALLRPQHAEIGGCQQKGFHCLGGTVSAAVAAQIEATATQIAEVVQQTALAGMGFREAGGTTTATTTANTDASATAVNINTTATVSVTAAAATMDPHEALAASPARTRRHVSHVASPLRRSSTYSRVRSHLRTMSCYSAWTWQFQSPSQAPRVSMACMCCLRKTLLAAIALYASRILRWMIQSLPSGASTDSTAGASLNGSGSAGARAPFVALRHSHLRVLRRLDGMLV